MSPEAKPGKISQLRLAELVISQNGSWSLTPKGKLVLELVQIHRTLLNAEKPQVSFAISSQLRVQLITKRESIAQALNLDEAGVNLRRLVRIVGKITQRTGIASHQIYSIR